jgi:hypothetical protein
MKPTTRVGYDYAHAIVDDHSRLAYVELHNDEKAATVTAFVRRALAFFAAHRIQLRRLMTDNAFTYTKNRTLRELLAERASGTSPPSPTGRAPTAKSSGSTRPWAVNGLTAAATPPATTAPGCCQTG